MDGETERSDRFGWELASIGEACGHEGKNDSKEDSDFHKRETLGFNWTF